jgi:glycosidase
MQTSFRPQLPSQPKRPVIPSFAKVLLLACACISLAATATAQTLARPGWVGSGMTTSRWWRNAVFYRVDPARFQDSDGDGTGDLRGLAQRTGYLQSLGVDAIILLPPFRDAGFDDLLAAASQHHIRIVIALRSQPGVNLVASARSWLTRGAAGIELLAHDPTAAATTDALSALHQLSKSYPGERVIIAGFDQPAANARNADLVDTAIYLTVAAAGETSAQPRSEPALSNLAADLHQSLTALQANAAAAPLFLTDDATRSATEFSTDSTPARTAALNQTAALLMLASAPAAANLLYGQELGLQKPFAGTMQWTPSNLTPPEPTETTEPEPTTPAPQPTRPTNPNTYGAFVPYIAPKSTKHETSVFNPNALRGFSTKPAEPEPAKPQHELQLADTSRNVAGEDHDSRSLLNFYKRLIQLHHDNPALRTGSLVVLNHNADNALVWLRVAPSSARTAPPVLIVCNLSSQTLYFSLADDLEPFHIRHVAIRNLLTSAPSPPIETTDRFSLPAYSVYVGEVYR